MYSEPRWRVVSTVIEPRWRKVSTVVLRTKMEGGKFRCGGWRELSACVLRSKVDSYWEDFF